MRAHPLVDGARRSGPFWARLGRAAKNVLWWRGWVDLVALAFLLGLAVFFNRDAFLSNRIFFENDTPAFYYPLLSRYAEAIEEGVLPLWTRAIFGGFPLFADSETGMLYPTNLLLVNVLPTWWAVVWHRVLVFALAAWFTYAFGRAAGFRPFAAAVAAVAFSYGSFLVAQLHHSNIVNSAIWLPLVFFAIEMALKSQGRRRYQWLVLGGVAMGMESLAVHVQVVLMTLLAALGYLGFRVVAGPVSVRLWARETGRPFLRRLWVAHVNVWLIVLGRSTALVAGLGLVALLGLALGAVQLLPLYELAQFSYRGLRVDYGFAATYSIAPVGLLQLIAPYLFRTQAGAWWTQFSTWETALYVGLPVLLLALLGALLVRNRQSLFFVVLTVGALIVALGPNAPLNLHRMLWELPGFSAMRAPGRFTLLVVFGAAVLAGWGAHWLDTRLSRRAPQFRFSFIGGIDRMLFGAVLGLATLAPVLLVLSFLAGRAWLDGHKAEALKALAGGEWGVRAAGGSAQAVNTAFEGMRWALDLTNPATAGAVVLLQATTALVVIWVIAPRLGHLCKGGLLALVVVDLLGFASVFHPFTSIGDLSTPSPAVAFLDQQEPDARVFPKPKVRSLDSNRMVPYSIPTLSGYSSLPMQRHLEYLHYLQTGYDTVPDVLLDVAGIRYLAREARFPGLPFHKYVSIDPGGPLAMGPAGNAGSRITLAGDDGRGDTLALVTALRHGTEIPQGATVAEVTIVTNTGERRVVPIRAGQDTAEWAFDRPDVAPKVKHRKPEVAFTFDQSEQEYGEFKVHLYYSEVPVGAMVTARSVEYRYIHPVGGLRLYGISLFDRRTKVFTQFRTKPRYLLSYRDDEAQIYENMGVLPRAYVVQRAVAASPFTPPLEQMTEGLFDPRQVVLLEPPPGVQVPRDLMVSEVPVPPPGGRPAINPARIERYESGRATIRYNAAAPGFLVFSDTYYPGWKAYLDGNEVPVYRANYLFRAVRAPEGEHSVEFRFEPQSVMAGMVITALALAVTVSVVLFAEIAAAVPPLARAAARVRHSPRSARWGAAGVAPVRRHFSGKPE